MDPQSLVIVLRMAERILGVLIGGVLIYFGYRLFLSLSSKRGREGGSGDFSFAGGNKIKLSKVGPGVFFALFGAALIVFSIARPVKFNASGPPAGKAAAGGESKPLAATTMTFMGATSLPENEQERIQRRAEMREQIAVLNRAVEQANPADRPQLEAAVAQAKLALMERLWTDDWGDLADFRAWLEKGGAPPAATQPAVEIFQRK